MELHAILEPGDTPTAGMWYVLSPKGEPPSMRVGHTITFIPGKDDKQGKMLLVGGANPSGPFNDLHILNLEFYEWDDPDWKGLLPRYEHSAFRPTSQPDKLYIFGGAEQGSNLNDIQLLDIGKGKWSSVSASGKIPSARTCNSMASIDDKLYIFGGGQAGAHPVGDRQVHVFNAVTTSWSQPNVKGNPPKPRHGHIMVAIGNKIYVHGGMAGQTFYDDLHELDTVALNWKQVKCKGAVPCSRTAHTGVSLNNKLYIFGGMGRDSALDDLYVLDTGNFKWSKIEISGPPPPPRLDHAMCVIEMKATVVKASEDMDREPQSANKDVKEVKDEESNIDDDNENTKALENAAEVVPDDDKEDGANDVDTVDSEGGVVKAEVVLDSAGEVANEGGALECVGGGAKEDSALESVERVVKKEGACAAAPDTRTYEMLLIHGGMDTQGEIFDDTLVVLVP
ncbi:uncharacterized protein LOC100373945 [Saccoglossus kowalevskii]|uniref:Rab9 effector protein with kelch motifs n=1 Tax=Saccoglossus kowalevskii TaxID=10224 RepID=A0ABM0H0K9_SACKO|nr:PREDICTED: rab9 effector protein with kelch motifs-like [Saccoglossus kowalevskii]